VGDDKPKRDLRGLIDNRRADIDIQTDRTPAGCKSFTPLIFKYAINSLRPSMRAKGETRAIRPGKWVPRGRNFDVPRQSASAAFSGLWSISARPKMKNTRSREGFCNYSVPLFNQIWQRRLGRVDKAQDKSVDLMNFLQTSRRRRRHFLDSQHVRQRVTRELIQ
jgi:hypothetical protein